MLRVPFILPTSLVCLSCLNICWFCWLVVVGVGFDGVCLFSLLFGLLVGLIVD